MTLQFTDLKVRSFDLDHLDIFWGLQETPQNLERWDFFVLRSIDGPAGPFREIAGPFRNTSTLRDPEVNLIHHWRTYFYKVRAVNKDTGDTVETPPAGNATAPPDRITLELRRRMNLLMEEFAGRRIIIYPALTMGFRCPRCFDRGSNDRGRTTGRPKMQNCASCFDTTWVGGYATPICVFGQIDPSPKSVQRSDTSEKQRQDSSARLSAFPPLKPKDMIVEAENIRWMVERLATTRKLRAVVHQEVTVHRIPVGDIKYRVPVNFDLLEQHGPAREFTRPMDVQPEPESPLNDFLDNMLGDS